jgi:hemoglobin
MNRITPLALLLAGALMVGGCRSTDDQNDRAKSQKTTTADKSGKTLWERLGGEPAVTAVVDDFVNRAAPDPKVNFTRKGHPAEWNASPANVTKLKRQLVAFISENSGGPIKYKGKDMTATHTGMNITSAEFDALAGHLVAALDAAGAKPKDRDELVKIVASTKGAMVGK